MKINKLASVILVINLMIIIIGNISYGANTTNSTNSSKTTKASNTSNTAKIQNKDDEEEGLESLKIEGAEISPEFKTDEYNYTVKYIGEDKKLQIEAIATETYYEVEITGNKDLKEGENLITILVSDTNGKNVATYQLTVNKSLVDEEAIAKEEAKNQEIQKNIAIIISCVVGAIIVLIIIIVIVKKK